MRWLLPEHVEDVLPAEAAKIEALRRALLDLFASRGYELVIPPLLEYVDSLLTGTGHDLDLRTFKLVDQLSGKMMGVRADITPQVARIDAHLLNSRGVTRLCYCGSVLHARPATPAASREPIQIGAELPLQDVDLAVVSKTYEAGASGGSVGVIGPMRMNYKRAISAVEEVSRELEDRISSETD